MIFLSLVFQFSTWQYQHLSPLVLITNSSSYNMYTDLTYLCIFDVLYILIEESWWKHLMISSI